MNILDLVRALRRDSVTDPAILERERSRLMATIREETRPQGKLPPRGQRIIPQLPYLDQRAAVEFLERAFGFRELVSARVIDAKGAIVHTAVEFGGAEVMIGGHGGHDALSPKSLGRISMLLSVYVDDVEAHCARARAAGARIVAELEDKFWGDRVYEVLDLEGHRWRFHEHLRSVPQEEWNFQGDE